MRKQKHHSTAAVSLLQAISHMVTVALAKVKKSNIKKKGEKKKGSGVRQFVEIVKARKPFISELDIVNIKNWES